MTDLPEEEQDAVSRNPEELAQSKYGPGATAHALSLLGAGKQYPAYPTQAATQNHYQPNATSQYPEEE